MYAVRTGCANCTTKHQPSFSIVQLSRRSMATAYKVHIICAHFHLYDIQVKFICVRLYTRTKCMYKFHLFCNCHLCNTYYTYPLCRQGRRTAPHMPLALQIHHFVPSNPSLSGSSWRSSKYSSIAEQLLAS